MEVRQGDAAQVAPCGGGDDGALEGPEQGHGPPRRHGPVLGAVGQVEEVRGQPGVAEVERAEPAPQVGGVALHVAQVAQEEEGGPEEGDHAGPVAAVLHHVQQEHEVVPEVRQPPPAAAGASPPRGALLLLLAAVLLQVDERGHVEAGQHGGGVVEGGGHQGGGQPGGEQHGQGLLAAVGGPDGPVLGEVEEAVGVEELGGRGHLGVLAEGHQPLQDEDLVLRAEQAVGEGRLHQQGGVEQADLHDEKRERPCVHLPPLKSLTSVHLAQ